MKILCLTPWFPGHAEDQRGNYILDSLNALKALGYEQKIWHVEAWRPMSVKKTFTAGFEVETLRYLSIPRYYLRSLSNYFYAKRLVSRLKREIAINRPDVIHVHTELLALPVVKLMRQYGIPVVVTVHGLETSKRYWQSSKIRIAQALNGADRVILVGEPLRAFFKKLVGRDEHFCVIANGFRFSPLLRNVRPCHYFDPIKLISVSNLHEGKGLDINLQALAQLNEVGYRRWHYMIVGDGYQRDALQSQVKLLQLDAQVQFLGALPHDEVYQQLLKAEVSLLPSYREAFGIAYLEAMAAGLLTIGVEGQGPSAFIESGKTGLLVKPQDVASVCEALKAIFNDQERMRVIAAAGQAFVSKYMTWEQHAQIVSKLYQALQ